MAPAWVYFSGRQFSSKTVNRIRFYTLLYACIIMLFKFYLYSYFYIDPFYVSYVYNTLVVFRVPVIYPNVYIEFTLSETYINKNFNIFKKYFSRL